MAAQLGQLRQRLDSFGAQADGARTEAKGKLLLQVEALRRVKVAVTRQLTEVESDTTERWHEVKGGLERVWQGLAGSVEALRGQVASRSARKC